MAPFGRLTCRTPNQLRQCRTLYRPNTRSFTTRPAVCSPALRSQKYAGIPWRQGRTLSTSPVHCATSQEAPNAQAYLQSGAIASGRNLVDVKKVLVIGSGGLSIG